MSILVKLRAKWKSVVGLLAGIGGPIAGSVAHANWHQVALALAGTVGGWALVAVERYAESHEAILRLPGITQALAAAKAETSALQAKYDADMSAADRALVQAVQQGAERAAKVRSDILAELSKGITTTTPTPNAPVTAPVPDVAGGDVAGSAA